MVRVMKEERIQKLRMRKGKKELFRRIIQRSMRKKGLNRGQGDWNYLLLKALICKVGFQELKNSLQ